MGNFPNLFKLLFAKLMSSRPRYIFICLSFYFALVLIPLVHVYRAPKNRMPPTPADIECYGFPQTDADALSIHEYKVLPNSIFFIETSCRHGGGVNITKRQACAFESAAKVHPDSEVLVLFPSPISLKNSSILVSELLNYPNIKFMHIDLEKYFLGTPLESFYKENRIKESLWPLTHMSDVLRYLTLWKYGGTYLDSDFLIIRPISAMENFAGAQSEKSINNGAMNFNTNTIGRRILDELLFGIRDNFRGDQWDANGPKLLSGLLRGLCNEDDILQMTPEKCHGFTVLPPSAFYPISFRKWKLYFQENVSQSVVDTMSQSYGIHVWNQFSKETRVKVGSKAPYDVFASKFCPQIYSVVGEYI